MNDTTTRARCYREFCTHEATRHVVVVNRSGNPELPAIPWGWCGQHVHEAWEHRLGQVCTSCEAETSARVTGAREATYRAEDIEHYDSVRDLTPTDVDHVDPRD